MTEKKKIGKPGAPRTLGVNVTTGSMGTHPLSGAEKGTVTHFSYFTSQDTGIDIKLIQLFPLSPDMLEAMKTKSAEDDDDLDVEGFEEFFDTLSWNFSVAAYFGRDDKRKLILRTFVISSKEAAKSFVELALTFARGEAIVSPLVVLKNSEEADEDEPGEPGYTSTLDVGYAPDPPVDGVKLMALTYSLVDDNSDTEFFTTPMELAKFLDLFERIDARLNLGS